MPRRLSQEDKDWAKAVKRRDGRRCQMPGCGRKGKLEAHHITRYADSHHLRLEIDNGITLCKSCHYEIRNREHHYASLFNDIVSEKRK